MFRYAVLTSIVMAVVWSTKSKENKKKTEQEPKRMKNKIQNYLCDGLWGVWTNENAHTRSACRRLSKFIISFSFYIIVYISFANDDGGP